MKKIEKVFWVSNYMMDNINLEEDFNITACISTQESGFCANKITISWERPDKKVTISESEFDELFKDFEKRSQWQTFYQSVAKEMKQKLFGG